MSATTLPAAVTQQQPIETHDGARVSALILAMRQSLRHRRDAWVRRELDAAQTARARYRETGGDFSTLP